MNNRCLKPRLCKVGHVSKAQEALYMPALVSIQCNPFMMVFYARLKEKGKNEKVIVSAIIRKLVHLIYANNDRIRLVLRRA